MGNIENNTIKLQGVLDLLVTKGTPGGGEATPEGVRVDFSSSGPSAQVYYLSPDEAVVNSLPVYTTGNATIRKGTMVCVVFGYYGTGVVQSDVGEVYSAPDTDNRVVLACVDQAGEIWW